MTILQHDAPPADPLGVQEPSLLWVPPGVISSTGREAFELAAMAGLHLDPWQHLVIDHALGERADGKWAAFEVGVEVARQNGKGGILEARELTGLFLLGERLLIHSAHEFATSLEAFHRMLALLESCPDLERMVQRVSRSHGDEGITLKGGQRLRYKTRTKGGGRGFSCDCLILDEAMHLPEAMQAALMPTLAARPNPQVWYAGSAVDEDTMPDGVVFARVRERAKAGGDPRLAYFGWGAPFDHPDEVTPEAAADPANRAAGNPGLGIRITMEHVESECRAMSHRAFCVERLGVGAWPATDGTARTVVPLEKWRARTDIESIALDPVRFAVDVSPDRAWASIGVAGWRADGLRHVEIVDRRRGVDWVAQRVADLLAAHEGSEVGCDAAGPVASLLPALAALDVHPTLWAAKEHAAACGAFYDAVDPDEVAPGRQLRHLGTSELLDALAGARTRPLGDAWGWGRKTSSVDVSPLVAVTLALWGLEAVPPRRKPLLMFARA